MDVARGNSWACSQWGGNLVSIGFYKNFIHFKKQNKISNKSAVFASQVQLWLANKLFASASLYNFSGCIALLCCISRSNITRGITTHTNMDVEPLFFNYSGTLIASVTPCFQVNSIFDGGNCSRQLVNFALALNSITHLIFVNKRVCSS